jgi:preprotein translocase subunit SecA
VITELWVEYLTQMESLRISIGLEAYAQRDPLVQYKNRAYELFQNLFNDMRTGVVTRMFTFRPRDNSSAQMNANRLDESAISADATEAVLETLEIESEAGNTDMQDEADEKETETADSSDSASRKRRRRRR